MPAKKIKIEAKRPTKQKDSGVCTGSSCSALRWTRNRPKSAGWYWLAAPIGYTPRIMRVWESSGGLTVQAEGGYYWPIKKRGEWRGCKWAGPILPPNVQSDGSPTQDSNEETK